MKLNNILRFEFSPNKDTYIAIILGLLSIAFSLLMIFFPTNFGHWIFRIIFQISIVGIVIPLYLMSKNGKLKEAGLRFNKPFIYILISIGIAGLLLFQFWAENNLLFSQLSKQSIEPAFYIIVANIYEVIFFVIFLRYSFEKVFGIIPAIILSLCFIAYITLDFNPNF